MFKKRKHRTAVLEGILERNSAMKKFTAVDSRITDEQRKRVIARIDEQTDALICATAEYAWWPINTAIAIAVSVIVTALGFIFL